MLEGAMRTWIGREGRDERRRQQTLNERRETDEQVARDEVASVGNCVRRERAGGCRSRWLTLVCWDVGVGAILEGLWASASPSFLTGRGVTLSLLRAALAMAATPETDVTMQLY